MIDPVEPQPGIAADDLLGLLDHLGLDRAHLIGTAGGAPVVLDFALSHPQRVRSLVIGEQPRPGAGCGGRGNGAPNSTAPTGDDASRNSASWAPSYRAANAAGTERWKELEKTSRPPGPLDARAAATPPLDVLLWLETIQAPTLVVIGGADLFAPPPLMRLFAARIKGAETFVAPDSGHSTYWEQPEDFNRVVLNFLGKH